MQCPPPMRCQVPTGLIERLTDGSPAEVVRLMRGVYVLLIMPPCDPLGGAGSLRAGHGRSCHVSVLAHLPHVACVKACFEAGSRRIPSAATNEF